jgi:hypothetical protein
MIAARNEEVRMTNGGIATIPHDLERHAHGPRWSQKISQSVPFHNS